MTTPMMIQSGGVISNKYNNSASSSSQIFGRSVVLKKKNASSKVTHLSHTDVRRSCKTPRIVCPKAVSDSSSSQTCLDPDASNVCTLC